MNGGDLYKVLKILGHSFRSCKIIEGVLHSSTAMEPAISVTRTCCWRTTIRDRTAVGLYSRLSSVSLICLTESLTPVVHWYSTNRLPSFASGLRAGFRTAIVDGCHLPRCRGLPAQPTERSHARVEGREFLAASR